MQLTYDPDKERKNLAKHGISLARAADMVIRAFAVDDRGDYGEPRFRAWGDIDGKPHALAYTVRDGMVRVISLRRAREDEVLSHGG